MLRITYFVRTQPSLHRGEAVSSLRHVQVTGIKNPWSLGYFESNLIQTETYYVSGTDLSKDQVRSLGKHWSDFYVDVKRCHHLGVNSGWLTLDRDWVGWKLDKRLWGNILLERVEWFSEEKYKVPSAIHRKEFAAKLQTCNCEQTYLCVWIQELVVRM